MAFFNNPAFGAAASSLMQMLAPPSGAEANGWANARAKQEEASRIAQLFTMAQGEGVDPTQFDRMGVAAGQWAPNQSYYSVDQSNATDRRGQDITASTSLSNNAADNARALQERQMQEAAAMERLGITDATQRYGIDTQASTSRTNNVLDNQQRAIGTLFGPLNPGQVRPDVPDDLMGALGLPGIGAVAGAPKPLSATEVEGEFMQTLLSEPEQRARAMGSTPVENIVTPEGPRVAYRTDAVGQEPFINQGAEAAPKMTNYQTPDGRTGTALFDPASRTLVDVASRQPLPEGTVTYQGNLQGSAEDIGLTNGVVSNVQRQVMSLEDTLGTVDQLIGLIQSSPSSQGVVGSLRGTAQNLIQTGNELGRYMGGALEEVSRDMERGLTDANLGGQFDPNIPAIDLMTNLLAWQYAKAMGGERVSNEQLRTARAAIGGTGMLGNQADSLTRLTQLRDNWSRELERNRQRLGELSPRQTRPSDPMAPAAPGAAPAAGGEGRVRTYNPATGRIE